MLLERLSYSSAALEPIINKNKMTHVAIHHNIGMSSWNRSRVHQLGTIVCTLHWETGYRLSLSHKYALISFVHKMMAAINLLYTKSAITSKLMVQLLCIISVFIPQGTRRFTRFYFSVEWKCCMLGALFRTTSEHKSYWYTFTSCISSFNLKI